MESYLKEDTLKCSVEKKIKGKKILLISPKDNNFYNFRKELIIQLKNTGYEVVLVCPYGRKIDYFKEHGCRFIDLDIDRRGTSFLNDLWLLFGYIKICRKEKPDVVLTYTTKCSVYGGMACRWLKIPYIVNNAGLIESDNRLLQEVLRVLYKIGFSGASCIMFQNNREKEVITRIVNGAVKYKIIPGSGVNLDEFAFAEYPTSDDVVVFNYVARIVSIKGISEFLSCAEIIKNRYHNTRFVIYGDYDDICFKDRIEKLIKKHIVEYGGVQLDMRPFIKAAHAVIHPSYYEGMTNVVLEHSAMGRVCIGSNIPGVNEGIEDKRTGFVFEVKNVDSMVDAVERFLALSNTEKAAMGKAAREKIEKEFNRDIVTNAYLSEIQIICVD